MEKLASAMLMETRRNMRFWKISERSFGKTTGPPLFPLPASWRAGLASPKIPTCRGRGLLRRSRRTPLESSFGKGWPKLVRSVCLTGRKGIKFDSLPTDPSKAGQVSSKT
ncbi:MAG: hypothetical protein H8E82_07575 [Candidatus Marinimicrobia bacterium]|nr:hypothetical protein [Candidatus Neomarinimicrobiota bacterium]